jgi:hypothetical protein
MPTRVTLYAGPATDGALSFYPSEGASAVAFDLVDGYSIGEGFTGVRMILGTPGTLGMSIDQAISRRVLWPAPTDPTA